MFNKKKPNIEIIRSLKKIFSKKKQIPDTSLLSIAELTCHEPNCPPIETIITERTDDGKYKNWKIAKPINDIKEVDFENLEQENSHKH